MNVTRPVVVVLAAGEGRRMSSAHSKMLHTVGGHTLLRHAIDAALSIDPSQLVVVVGYQREQVCAHLAEIAPGAKVAYQERQVGTGDAARAGLSVIDEAADGTAVVVMCADLPLFDGSTLLAMVDARMSQGDAVTVLGCPDDDDGVGVFDLRSLRSGLDAAGADEHFSLADVVSSISLAGGRVGTFKAEDDWAARGVDDHVQLAAVGAEYNRRLVERWMRAGVTVIDPATTWIEADVDLGADVTLWPGTMLMGATSVAAGASIGPETTVKDSEIDELATITRSTVELSVVGAQANVGPYARLRPGSQVGQSGVIGTFVETKNAILGDGARLGHLTYCGDATLGDGVDVGAGVIFANWDSTNKAHIHIGADAVIGAGALIVPPVDVPAGAVVPPGTTVGPSGPEADAEARRYRPDDSGEIAKRGLEDAI